MFNWAKFVVLVTAPFLTVAAYAQTAPVQNERAPHSKETSEYSEVFGLSRSNANSGYSQVFALSSTEELSVPQSRQEWLEIAEHIRMGEMNFKVYYAMLRGEKPEDIITPELMTLYKPIYEDWLLKKLEAEERELPVGQDGTDYLNYHPSIRTECDPNLNSNLRQSAESTTLPTSDQLNAMYRTMLNKIACEKED